MTYFTMSISYASIAERKRHETLCTPSSSVLADDQKTGGMQRAEREERTRERHTWMNRGTVPPSKSAQACRMVSSPHFSRSFPPCDSTSPLAFACVKVAGVERCRKRAEKEGSRRERGTETHNDFPSSKSIVLLESFHVESIFNTCHILDLTPITSWLITFAGIFIFCLWGWVRQQQRTRKSQSYFR